jgi:hypothetical protein
LGFLRTSKDKGGKRNVLLDLEETKGSEDEQHIFGTNYS